MTTSPARPLLHSYEGENPFDIVDSAWGTIERWRAQALATGEASGLTAIADHVRNDAIARMDAIEVREANLNSRQDALDQRERGLGVIAAQIADLAGRAAVVWDRIERARADAQEEPLASPPGQAPGDSHLRDSHLRQHIGKSTDAIPGDPSHPNKQPEPSLELEDDTHAIDPEERQHVIPADNYHVPGEFPRLNRPIAPDATQSAHDQAEFPDPQLPHPPVVKQPVSVGLDTDIEKEETRGH